MEGNGLLRAKVKPLPVWRKRLRRHFPITRWLPTYGKGDLVADFVAGLTLGLTMIPQSIAYAALAGLAPHYGLYSTFMGGFVYVLLGTIKEVSTGPSSLQSLLTYEFTKDLPVEFVIFLTFCAGIVELLMGLLQLGFLVDFMSAPVICGFQSATAMIIVTSQLKWLLGLRKFKAGQFLDNILILPQKLKELAVGDTLLGVISIIILLSLRKMKDLKWENYQNRQLLMRISWFISISRNSVVVLVSMIFAIVFHSYEMQPFVLSGNITSGLPPFAPPPFSTEIDSVPYSFLDMLLKLKLGLLIVPLVAVINNVGIAKAFSRGTAIDATQEMIALGFCNILGSFVSSMPTCGALTRSAVSYSSGVRTPLAGLFSGGLILLVISFFSQYFYFIPRATLAAVLISAIIFMFDYNTMFLLWRANKRDFICCMTTFLVCLFFGIEIGLLVGMVLNIGQLVQLWARPTVTVTIEESPKGSYYLVRPDIGLFFPAIDFFRNELQKHCRENLPIVVDCLHFKGIDYTTAQGLSELLKDYGIQNRKILFINMSILIRQILTDCKIDMQVQKCNYHQDEMMNILFNFMKESPTALVLENMDKNSDK